MDYKKSLASLLAKETKQEGKIAIALLAGIAIGGILTNLFSSKNILKVQKSSKGGARMINLKDSYTEMSNRLAN